MNLSDLNNLAGAVLATSDELPPIRAAGYEYIIAGNGLFIRAEDSRMEAMVFVGYARLHGLTDVKPYARLKIPRVPVSFLYSILVSATRHLPAECMFQLHWDGLEWHCRMPAQTSSSAAVEFADASATVIDLHSHGLLHTFFSETDNRDEQGLRFYAVVGDLRANHSPTMLARVGVYGHHAYIPVSDLFDIYNSPVESPFDDLYNTKVDSDVELPF